MGEGARTLILGLGNTALRDDGAGIHACRLAADMIPEGSPVDVLEAEIAGFGLLDLLEGYRRVVVIDAVVQPGLTPGDVVTVRADELRPSAHLVGGHEIDLPTALELGRRLGMAMPEDIVIVGIQACDMTTLDETPTSEVAAALPLAAETALRLARL